MSKIIKMILLPLLLVSILSLPASLGCNGNGDGGSSEFTKAELEEIVANSINVVNTADSYKFSMDMEMFMDMEGGGEDGTMNMDIEAEGAFDLKKMEAFMDMDMYMAMDIGFDMGSEEVSMEMYMLDDYVYIRAEMPGMGDEWMKMEATDDALEMYGLDMLEQQMAPLESIGELSFLRYESINGKECYVIKIVPDMDAMMDYLGDQEMADLGMSWDELDMMYDMFDELSYTCWIEKDTGYMAKMNAYILMEVSGGDFRDLTGVSGKMTMDMTMNMEMHDFNEPADIVLPDEAEDAMEMGTGDFMF